MKSVFWISNVGFYHLPTFLWTRRLSPLCHRKAFNRLNSHITDHRLMETQEKTVISKSRSNTSDWMWNVSKTKFSWLRKAEAAFLICCLRNGHIRKRGAAVCIRRSSGILPMPGPPICNVFCVSLYGFSNCVSVVLPWVNTSYSSFGL